MYTRIIKYLLALIVFIAIANGMYNNYKKSQQFSKSSRVECNKNSTTFERVYKTDEIKYAQDRLKSGDFILSSSIKKAIHTKSKLFEFVKLDEIDKVVLETINSYKNSKQKGEEKLNISYYIYENDVNDPGKKTKKSKLYAGYVVFRFINNKEEIIYQIQIDFMDKKGTDLPQQIKCAIKSFITL